jgi:hypothetical protein
MSLRTTWVSQLRREHDGELELTSVVIPDLEAVVWLEAYLSTYNHILVITSHSQDFMDSVSQT